MSNGISSAPHISAPMYTASAAPTSSSSSSSTPVQERTFAESLHDHFDAVFRRVTMGRRDLKAVKAYLESRASCEKAYADRLAKDNAAAPELADSSSSGPVWLSMKEAAATVSAQHATLASLCLEQTRVLKTTIDTLKSTKTSMQERYTRITDECRAKQKAHDQAYKAYADATKQAEVAIQTRDHNRQLPPQQQGKFDQQVTKTLTALNGRHEEYKRAVQVLKDAQVKYDAEVIDIMQQFERVEVDRLRTFNDVLQRYTAAHDAMAQGDTTVAATLHRSVATIDNRKDIQDYIVATTTNTRPRPHVEYHPISSAIIDAHGGGPSVPKMPAPGYAQQQQQPPLLAQPQPGIMPMQQPAQGYGGVQIAPPVGYAPGMAQSSVLQPQPNGIVVTAGVGVAPHTVSPTPSSSPSGQYIPPPPEPWTAPPVNHAPAFVAIALFDFEGGEADDLSFKAGDVIALTQFDEGDDWWMGDLHGKTGIFPKNFVRKEEAQHQQGLVSAAAATPPQQGVGVPAQAPAPALAYAPLPSAAYAVPPPAAMAAAPLQMPGAAGYEQYPAQGAAAVVISPPIPVSSMSPATSASLSVPTGAPSSSSSSAYTPATPLDPPQPLPQVPQAADNGQPPFDPSAAAAAPEQPREMDARCEALFDFQGQDVDELSFHRGDQLVITGELNGWYLGKISNTERVGIFPSNYVSLLPE